MRFEGDAKYEEGDGYLRFEKLIVSEKRADFDLVSVTQEYGRWHAIGSALKGGDVFQSQRLYASQNGARSDAFSLRFTVEISPDKDCCRIDGVWIEAGEDFLFTGTLYAANDESTNSP